jgi:hypothetical protein
MTHGARDTLTRQLDIAWQLTSYHLDGLSTEECLWRPAAVGLHVHQSADGTWHADWPEHEGYDLGPPSIGWLTWHLVFWWSMVLDHSFHGATLTRDRVDWPGSAEAVRERVSRLHDEWVGALAQLDAEEWRATTRTRWPFQDRPFADVVAWATVELTKNASEIGYARFCHAVRGAR